MENEEKVQSEETAPVESTEEEIVEEKPEPVVLDLGTAALVSKGGISG